MSPSLSSLARMKLSIGFRVHDFSFTSGNSGRLGGTYAQCVSHFAPSSIPERRIQSTVCDAGHVTLTGAVTTLQQRDDAERVVASLDGVRLVTNQITIEAPAVAPGELRSSIKAALERHVAREADRIAIDVEGHTVVLSGSVASWRERQAVIGAAKGTPGVQRIEDRLQIAS